MPRGSTPCRRRKTRDAGLMLLLVPELQKSSNREHSSILLTASSRFSHGHVFGFQVRRYVFWRSLSITASSVLAIDSDDRVLSLFMSLTSDSPLAKRSVIGLDQVMSGSYYTRSSSTTCGRSTDAVSFK